MAIGFYVILLISFGAISVGLCHYHIHKVKQNNKDIFSIIAIITWNNKSRKIFITTFICYGIFFSLVSGTLVYQPDVSFSQHYGAKIPSSFIENHNTRIGNIEGNIFYEDIVEIGKKVGLNFIINVILNENNKVVELKAGEPLATHKTLIKLAKQISEFQIKNTFDVAVCGVGFPKDTNIYQTSRAASYIFYLPRPIVRNGGYIIIPAICNEGAGKGIGEQRFFEMLNRMTLNEILYYSEKFKAGEQRAFMMANVLKSCNVIIVGSSVPEIVKSIKMIPAATMSEAFQIVTNDLGKDLKMILIPNVLSILPIIKSTQT